MNQPSQVPEMPPKRKNRSPLRVIVNAWGCLLALLMLAFFRADDLVQAQRYREMLAEAGINPQSAQSFTLRLGWDEALTSIAGDALQALHQ
jgi:hypothetical protein